MSSPAKTEISIVGAGFSGLTLAYQMQRLGYVVKVYERAEQVGGMIQKKQSGSLIADSAANAIMLTPIVLEMFQQLKIPYLMASDESNKRFIYRSHPRRWPLGFFETLALICRALLPLLFVRKIFKPKLGETVHTWGMRCFGKALATYVLAPAINGIYASPTENLSAELIIGKFFRKSRKAGRSLGLVSGETCMYDLLLSLQKSLEGRGVQFHFGSQPSDWKTHKFVFICTRADEAADLLEGFKDPITLENAALLRQITYVPLGRFNLQFPDPPPNKYQGFGILFSRDQGIQSLGVLQNSNIFKRRAPYNESWIVSDREQLRDSEMTQKILEDRSLCYKTKSQSPQASVVVHWPKGIPEYSLRLMEIIRQLKPMQGIFLHGNYLGQLGLSGIAESSYTLAQVFHRKHQAE